MELYHQPTVNPEFVAAIVLERLSEDEIAEAVRVFYKCTRNVAKPAGAAPLAGLIRKQVRYKDKRAAVICSGGNIDAAVLGGILTQNEER